MLIKDFYDVIVIGGGPAGTMSAKTVAENGIDVLLLERDREIGIPVRCAEGVAISAIDQFFPLEKRWIATEIYGTYLYSPDGNRAYISEKAIGRGLVLERRLFDSAIAEYAAKKGAKILTKANAIGLVKENGKICGVVFTLMNVKYKVRCNIVIGADGIESRVGRWAGLDTRLSLNNIESSAQYVLTDIDVDSHSCHFYFGNEIAPGGYAWIFPKGRNIANIGIGVSAERLHNNAKYYLDKFVQEKFPNASIIAFIAGAVPTSGTLPKITSDNVMLIGDAARQVNPVTGGGIASAIISGQIAGKIAAQSIKSNNCSNNFLNKYHKQWMKIRGNRLKILHKLKESFFTLTDKQFCEICRIANQVDEDKLNLFQLFKIAVKGNPKLLAELVKAYLT